MTWPIPTLPTNWTNVSPQLDAHPTAHNQLADAINELYKRLPRGVVGRTVATASSWSTSSTTVVDITVTAGQAPTLTLALDPTRLYKATFNVPFTMSTTVDRAVWELYVNGVSMFGRPTPGHAGSASSNVFASIVNYFTPPVATAIVYKMMARVSAGQVALPFLAATDPLEFIIEDCGRWP